MVVPMRFHRFRVWADQRPVSERTAAAGQSPIVSFAGMEPGQQYRHPAVSASWGGGVTFSIREFPRVVLFTGAPAAGVRDNSGSRTAFRDDRKPGRQPILRTASRFLSPTVERNP